MRQAQDAGLALDEARRRIARLITVVEGVQEVSLIDALDRVLAIDLQSTVAVPAHDNAAMDGYALPRERSSDAKSFRIVGEARAGHPFNGTVDRDGCVRIMTGSMMPVACDAVVPQERVTVIEDRVRVDADVAPGQHRRLAGEDLEVGALALPGGRRIVPSDLGVAASIGAATLMVYRRPIVAVFSTGSELREPGDPLPPGAIRDANRYTLIGMLRRIGVEAIDLGIVADDPEALVQVIARACGESVRADAIITSGGVSVGDADHTRPVLERLGAIDFWSLAIKPGRPMAFGRVNVDGRSALLFGLPGNPVAVMVVFYALVREALLAMSGASFEAPVSVAARCEDAIAKLAGRTEFVRGILTAGVDGWHVRATLAQGSGVLRSMSEANGLIVLEHDRGPVVPGDLVEVQPFQGLV